MMATVDSGTETLFSDGSPCELSSPAICTDEISAVNAKNDVNSRLAPPNIQPYSGVLEKGKVVIRPIAFKPTLNSRFGLAGERYGSTPILTRPGSRLTLYGSSNDLRQTTASMNNYSLDRKLRSSSQSVTSSSPLGLSSLTSLPHKLMNYDSLESVRKSPASTIDGSIVNKTYRLASAGGGSLLDLTPSPSDSGVSELEAALRDRDSELAYLRQTMEHNEQVIFRVYQEKERSWERELRRLKALNDNTLRTSSQKIFKLEQMMMMQNYQFQQEKKRLCAENLRTHCQNERLMQEIKLLKEKLEESEWMVCEKTGEISLFKSQLKDSQNDVINKGHECLQLRNENRETRNLLEARESELKELKSILIKKDKEVENYKKQFEEGEKHQREDKEIHSETNQLRKEIEELREELLEVSMSEYEGMEPGRKQKLEKKDLSGSKEFLHLKMELDERQKEFEKERIIWVQEKEKVLRYQKQLQMNYVQMYRRTRALEAEVESLTIELELDKTGIKNIPNNELNQTIEL